MPNFRGFVYFIQCPANGLIKIGMTIDHPDKRLGELRRGSPFPLEPLGVVRGRRQVEATLHVRFHAFRSHGEWFRPGQDVMEFIAEHARPWPSPNPQWRREVGDGYEEWFKGEFNRMADWAFCTRRMERVVAINRLEAGEVVGLA